jgi:hypothetical protein
MLHPSVGGVDEPGDVTCHLDLGLLKSTRAGQHNFIGLLATTVSDAGMRVFFELNSTQLNSTQTRPAACHRNGRVMRCFTWAIQIIRVR